jgi:ParB family chromosome partitioning protein
MEQQGEISAPEQDELLDEFFYLYQIMGILIPDLNKKSLPEFIDHLKEK